MTITVKITPQVRAGQYSSHFVAVFYWDGKNFVDSGRRLSPPDNTVGKPADTTEEALYDEGRAVLLVEGWRDGSMESGERCPDIIPLIDRHKDATSAQGVQAVTCQHQWEHLHGTDKNNEYRCTKCGQRK